LSVLGLVVAALLVCVPGAFASTLTKSGPDVSHDAAPGINNDVEVEDPDPDTLIIYTGDDPVVYNNTGPTDEITPGGDCKDTDGTPTDGSADQVTCTNTTGGTYTFNSGDGDDWIDASPDSQCCGSLDSGHHLNFNGGSGNDEAYGSDTSDILNGDGGDDLLRGSEGDDVVNGGDGNDNNSGDKTLVGGLGNDVVNGGNGNDGMSGAAGEDTLNGGAGDDVVIGDCSGGGPNNCSGGPDGNDTLNGGDGRDDLRAQGGDDVINGDGGDDLRLGGGPGNDRLNGGDGNDGWNMLTCCPGQAAPIDGGPGDDVLNGGNGDDLLVDAATFCCPSPSGNDVINGGAGYDHLDYFAGGSNNDAGRMTLDGVADDGYYDHTGCCNFDDRSNNFGADIESVYFGSDSEPVTGRGTDGPNHFATEGGADDIIPGAGTDVVYTNEGPDTINTDDGEADYVNCGRGVDKLIADNFDSYFQCEDVTINQRTSRFDVPQDAAPTVSWVSPAKGSTLRSGGKLEAAAADDKGIARVVFSVGLRQVCVDTTAPYTCDYQPQGADVGKKKVLIATAVDTAGQLATAFNEVNVSRIAPRSVSSKTSPKSDNSAPWTFRTTGRVNRPAGVSAAEGCKGNVTVQIRAGRTTLSNRRVGVKSDCTFASRVTFSNGARFTQSKLQVLVRFLGNEVLGPRSAKRGSVQAIV
jgi:Ca2+-binding RTX toxin-like protein